MATPTGAESREPKDPAWRALLRLACYLRDYLPQAATEGILLAVNQARCMPPYDGEHVRQSIVADVYRRYPQKGEPGHPRAIIPGLWEVRHE